MPRAAQVGIKVEKTEARGKGTDIKRILPVMSTRDSRFMEPFGITKEKEKESWRCMGTLCPGEYETCLFTL